MSEVLHLAAQNLLFVDQRTGVPLSITSDANEKASVSFCDTVDNLMLRYVSYVDLTRFTTIPNHSTLELETTFEDASRLVFVVNTGETAINSLMRTRRLAVRAFTPEDDYAQRHEYVFNPGVSEVKRSDLFPVSQEELRLQQEIANSEAGKANSQRFYNLPTAEKIDVARRSGDNMKANNQLARELGYNHLPVTAKEVEALAALANLALPLSV